MADEPVWDLSYYRHLSTDSATIYHVPVNHASENPAATLTRDIAYAIPYQTGHGGTITGAQINMSGTSSDTILRLAFYARTGSFDAYPRALIADLGSVACASAFTTWSFAAVVTTPHDQWWLVYTVNSNISTLVHESYVVTPIYGRARTDLNDPPALLNYPQPFSSCWVATFPASASILDQNPPQLGLRYGAFP